MGLTEFFDTSEAQLAETLRRPTPPRPVPTFRRYKKSIKMEDDFPRVAWVMGREVITGRDQVGGDGIGNPSTLWKRGSMIEAHIWEKDVRAVEVLMGHLVAAIHTCFPGEYIATGGTWLDDDAVNRRGVVYVLNLTVYFPITREPEPTANIDDFPIDPDLVPLT